ncbi:hypothetical protein VTK73DRAFT_2532 [Phialemonium thermophilum]|uniref:Uncharacterized protein n=1 Tax=Phialemonium thermophilum TaxID=223376 RepID=A0ABR3X3T5_9PEZI
MSCKGQAGGEHTSFSLHNKLPQVGRVGARLFKQMINESWQKLPDGQDNPKLKRRPGHPQDLSCTTR